MPQASFLAFARSCDLDPDWRLLRHSDAAAERQPYAAAVIAIDAIERRIDGVVAFPVVTKSPVHPRGEL
jgi:hypothetical protein